MTERGGGGLFRHGRRASATLAAAAAALALGLPVAAADTDVVPQAPPTTKRNQTQAASVGTRLSVAVSSAGGTAVVISGQLLEQSNRPIPGNPVLVRIDGNVVGVVTTGANGEYSVRAPFPAPGNHRAEASFGGNGQLRAGDAAAQFVIEQPAAAPPPAATTSPPPTTEAPQTTAPPPTTAAPPASPVALTATVAPATAYPGAVIEVAGTLTMNGAPVSGAQVDVTIDWGGGTANTVTSETGAFSAVFTLPTTGAPPKATVALAFPGEDGVPAATGAVDVPIGAAPPSSAVPSPSVSRSTPTTAPLTALPTATASSAAPVPKQQAWSKGDLTRTVGTAIGFVALAALAVLATLWLVAFGGHRLLKGERRGFGSDFGARRSGRAARPTAPDPGPEDVRQD